MRTLLMSSLVVLGVMACQQQAQVEAPATTAPSAETATALSTNAGGEVTIQVGSQFSPASITVPQGQPVRLAFHRGSDPTCADEVVFPDLNIRTKLPENQTTIVELPPQNAGTLNFACGMDMMKGQLVVQ